MNQFDIVYDIQRVYVSTPVSSFTSRIAPAKISSPCAYPNFELASYNIAYKIPSICSITISVLWIWCRRAGFAGVWVSYRVTWLIVPVGIFQIPAPWKCRFSLVQQEPAMRKSTHEKNFGLYVPSALYFRVAHQPCHATRREYDIPLLSHSIQMLQLLLGATHSQGWLMVHHLLARLPASHTLVRHDDTQSPPAESMHVFPPL